METLSNFVARFKAIVFEFLFILHHNKLTNKHLINFAQLLEIIPLLYFYLNPIYPHLHNFDILRSFLENIYPQLFLFTESNQFLASLALLLTFPAILISIFIMKLTVGYQYLLVLAIQIWLICYPILFIKFTIQSFHIMLGFPNYRAIGIFVAIVHTLGSVMVLHLYDKKHKLIDLLPILLIYLKVNSYAVLAIVIVRLILSYFISQQTILKPMRMWTQTSLLIVLVLAFFASPTLTNYVSFIMIITIFMVGQMLSIVRNYNKFEPIFYYLQNLDEDQGQEKMKYYDFIEDHRINCQNVLCMCRELGKETDDQKIKQKAYQFVQKLYSFKEDFPSRILLGQVCCQHYQYTLSGLLLLLTIKPAGIYEEYLLYYIKTKYEQEYRKHDKNYAFGQQYHNVFQDLRSFQQKIQNLTIIIKNFWTTILSFDGSKKFLYIIIDVSQKITQIRQLYEMYIDKYEEWSNNFRYLYKTFEIAILNLMDKENEENSFGIVKQEINIKVPERQLFFVSNFTEKIINCNRQFCNLVEIDKQDLINKSYNAFIPKTCTEEHNKWVKEWYENYCQEEQVKETIKPILLTNGYMKSVKMQNKILPRFDAGIEIITFIKLINRLQVSSIHKSSNVSTQQIHSESQDSEMQTFFSFLIEKNTMKIIGMDDAFFYTTFIEQSDDLRRKILNLKLNEMFPKVVISQKDKEGSQPNLNETYKEAMLNYSALEQFLQSKEKNLAFNAMAATSKNNIQLSKSRMSSIVPQQNDERLSFARKSKKKLSTISNLNMMTGNPHIKQNFEQMFLYEVIEQKNKGLDIEYCLVNFKLKKNINFEIEVRNKDIPKQKIASINTVEYQPKIPSQEEGEGDENSNQLKHPEGAAALFANLSHRQPFIRSSKPYKEDNKQEEIETKKAELQEQDDFDNEQKNFCLPWPILLPLFAVHIIYLNMQSGYKDVLTYLQKTFNFYDLYEMQILKRLDILFDNSSYIQNLKMLWIQGFGFYHKSILAFENPKDPFFVNKLYQQVIKVNHYGIYQQISDSLKDQINQLDLLYHTILGILIGFLFYVFVDFVFSLFYCFKISNKVTEIVLIFLNISQSDIRKMISSIQKYQNQVLEIVDFAEIQRQKAIEREQYNIQNSEGRQIGQLSGIGLLKDQNYGFYLQSNMKNADSLANSPIKNDSGNLNGPLMHNIEDLNNPLAIFPRSNKAKRTSMSHRRRSSRVEKINIQRLKQSMALLKSPSEDQIQQSFSGGSPKKSQTRKSNFMNISKSVQDDLKQSNFSSPSNFIDKINQQPDEESEISPEEEAKRQNIEKFKQKFRGKINDMKENPKSYIFLLVTLLLISGVFVGVSIMIPSFATNFEKFSQSYFNLRKLKIVILKQLINKQTSIKLQPDITASVYSQDFFFSVQSDLGRLEKFKHLWQDIYSNNVCDLVMDKNPQIYALCLGINNTITSYGQKVMFQYFEDYMKRKAPIELFKNSLTNPSRFMKVTKLQIYLIDLGQMQLSQQINEYIDEVYGHEMLMISIGTAILLVCILFLRKALSDIRSKINDGENLLLVMPQNIKKKYIEEMKKNRMKELTQELSKKQDKRKGKKRKSRTLEKYKNLEEPEQSGVQLITNNSALMQKQQEKVLKNSLKNPLPTNQTQPRVSQFAA